MKRKRIDDSSKEFRREVEAEALVMSATDGICEMLEKNGMSRADLAREIGRTRGYVTQLLSGERNMTLHTLSDLAFACNARVALTWEPLSQTLEEPEILDEQWEVSANVVRAVGSNFTFNEGVDFVKAVPHYARYKSAQALEKRNIQPSRIEQPVEDVSLDPGTAA